MTRSQVASAILVGVSVLASVLGQTLMKSGTTAASGLSAVDTLRTALVSPAVIGGLTAYAVGSLVWLVVLSRVDVSFAYPFGASSYVLVAMAAALMGEPVPALRWMGVVGMVTGLVIVGLGARPTGERS